MNDSTAEDDRLVRVATRVANLLRKTDRKVVLAESCTAGLIAATLSRVPGISEFLCGSFVTYRNASKSVWLNVSADDLDSPEVGPVSATVARQMAHGALAETPEADVAVSVTGHLGPGSPPEFDGVAYTAIQARNSTTAEARRISLDEGIEPAVRSGGTLRYRRQRNAVYKVLEKLVVYLDEVDF